MSKGSDREVHDADMRTEVLLGATRTFNSHLGGIQGLPVPTRSS